MFWQFFWQREWLVWSWPGAAIILGTVWCQVQLDVIVNAWFGSFFDLLQKALEKPGNVTADEFYASLWNVSQINFVSMFLSTTVGFFTKHWLFRWRQALNDGSADYVRCWYQNRHIEGASQRVQEDTARFAALIDNLGVALISSLLTLMAFMPILIDLSKLITIFPLVGEVHNGLVYLTIIWAVFGTVMIALVGVKLPGLKVQNELVEAAYRKELVLGEDRAERADMQVCDSLFDGIRTINFRIYLNYTYFDAAKWCYLHFGGFIPYLALGPTIVAAGFTYGQMQQITHAFGKVEGSFQFLVRSWSTIVDLISVHTRLTAFEVASYDGKDTDKGIPLKDSIELNTVLEV
ncbi:unnamed protein product [Prorocentrum cordatum]|uniref:ABC transmembrane type-1 domain-containing protein n=1 Tax=Prorocentrum cordatum TaxID=2364126 RepID=A0ABN9Q310_9DINO|nr:unnamed protein product [Polarella glacialis]